MGRLVIQEPRPVAGPVDARHLSPKNHPLYSYVQPEEGLFASEHV